MPYKSAAQRAYMHAHRPEIAARWDAEYPETGKLPEHVAKPRRPKRAKARDTIYRTGT